MALVGKSALGSRLLLGEACQSDSSMKLSSMKLSSMKLSSTKLGSMKLGSMEKLRRIGRNIASTRAL